MLQGCLGAGFVLALGLGLFGEVASAAAGMLGRGVSGFEVGFGIRAFLSVVGIAAGSAVNACRCGGSKFFFGGDVVKKLVREASGTLSFRTVVGFFLSVPLRRVQCDWNFVIRTNTTNSGSEGSSCSLPFPSSSYSMKFIIYAGIG
jgi:hypothetical protein